MHGHENILLCGKLGVVHNYIHVISKFCKAEVYIINMALGANLFNEINIHVEFNKKLCTFQNKTTNIVNK